jgi:diguanylate cyclase (GGDEF)-like protein
MFLLTIVSSLSILVIIQYKKRLSQSFSKDQNRLQEVKGEYETLLQKYQDIKTQREFLDEEYQDISTLYEVTKTISRTLSKEKVFEEFYEILKTLMNVEECLLFEKGKIDRKLENYFIFPLNIGQENIGTLAVRGISNKNKDKFIILANQFALVLRRAELYQTVQELSTTDSLTQVLVKRYCLVRLEEEFLRSKRRNLSLSCLMFDIDNFKEYNDKFGHLVGDIVLRDVSRAIKNNIREIDLLGRFGGEEFLLVLPETEKQSALFVAERIRKAVSEISIQAYEQELKVTISVGIATFPQDSDNYMDLIDKADKALYEAKKTGKNRVCLYSTKQ